MTNEQWKAFEDTLHLAPEVTVEMYNGRPEMTNMELIDISRTLHAGCSALQAVEQGYKFRDVEEQAMFAQSHFSLLAGLYGRLMGLAKAYDEAITKQAVLEAELATTGK